MPFRERDRADGGTPRCGRHHEQQVVVVDFVDVADLAAVEGFQAVEEVVAQASRANGPMVATTSREARQEARRTTCSRILRMSAPAISNSSPIRRTRSAPASRWTTPIDHVDDVVAEGDREAPAVSDHEGLGVGSGPRAR
jgi:hypothetical protein